MSKSTKSVSSAVPQVSVSATPQKVAKPAKVHSEESKDTGAKKASKSSAPAVAAVVVEVVAPEVKSAKKKASAPKVKKEPTEVVSSVVPEAPESAEAVTLSSAPSDHSEFMTKLNRLSCLISTLKSEFRLIEKKTGRELKAATKAVGKRKRKSGNRSPSGFTKPTMISDTLSTFLGKQPGTLLARTEVTREINAYIRTNQLQDKTNGRRINADAKLSTLLGLKVGDELTYFNLQRYMSGHFTKAVAPVVAVATA